jgi:MoaA/NifB/PqqE/SkfB family radical SAM enzyme
MTMPQVRQILQQAKELGTVEWIYFEGGEPFLYHPVLVRGVEAAKSLGFRLGLVSNGYWATSYEDAIEWLRPFTGLVEDLSISSDLYHSDRELSYEAATVQAAAESIGIPVNVSSVAQPDVMNNLAAGGSLPSGQASLRYRGRAAETLAGKASLRPGNEFTTCPYEELRGPERVHVDPFGYVHVCQGIAMGNLFDRSLKEIVLEYQPDDHPVIGPLLRGGPAALCELDQEEGEYADACHLCYETRKKIRKRFPETLVPGQMYGEV